VLFGVMVSFGDRVWRRHACKHPAMMTIEA
jgi:hypothetical protein